MRVRRGATIRVKHNTYSVPSRLCGEEVETRIGMEEIEIIAPAVEQCRARGVEAQGPYPSDTVFVRAKRGDFDAVVSMYHDQGQIAMKLMGFDHGVTLHGGLPVPVATCASGTAFDIAGKGIANVEGLQQAFSLASRMATLARAA